MLLRLYQWWDSWQQQLGKNLLIDEIDTAPFFKGPNPISNYKLIVRYGLAGRMRCKLSAFSTLASGIVDEKRQTLLFAAPKCGSTSLRSFAQNELELVAPNERRSNAHYTKLPLVFDSFQPNEAKALKNNSLNWNHYREYRKVLIIRKPYDRLVSFFWEKFVVNQANHHLADHIKDLSAARTWPILMKYDQAIQPLKLSFSQFIKCLFENYQQHKKVWDPHLGRQITADFERLALKDCELVPLTKLNDFFDQYLSHNRVENKVKVHENRSNSSHTRRSIPYAYDKSIGYFLAENKRPPTQDFYNEELDKMIREMYGLDHQVWQQAHIAWSARKSAISLKPEA
jgi:hypothetical protein